MKKKLLTLFASFILTILIQNTYSQQWLSKLPQDKQGDYTFFEYQQAFNNYWADYNVSGGWYIDDEGNMRKASGWKQFKRAEWYWKYRVDNKTGEFPKVSAKSQYEKWLQENPQTKTSTQGAWTSIGPSNANSPDFGTGRVNCITFDPNNDNHFWVGAPAGGVWETTNGGNSWTVLTDNNEVLGISDICLAQDYATSKTIYITTGDKDGGSLWSLNGGQSHDNEGVGILKTTDGGVTWQTTGLSNEVKEQVVVARIIAHPSNSTTLWTATNKGIYKSTDAGATWSKKQGGAFIDMKMKPGDVTILYASTSVFGTPYPQIYKSIDSGENWSIVKQFTFEEYRIDLAVTPADPTVVYAVVTMTDYSGGYTDYGALYGIFKSTDSGTTFPQVYDGTAVNKNLLGWKTNGSDAGGQGDFDLAIAVSPTDANEIYVGGVNMHKSTDGAGTFTAVSCWTSSITYNNNSCAVVHADHHMAKYRSSDGTLFNTNDGGVFYTTDGGSTWTDITPGLVNGQLYGMSVAQDVPGQIIGGFQDNGTKLLRNGTSDWADVIGGDGMNCAIDKTDHTIQYGTYANGRVYKSTDDGAVFSIIRNDGSADWAAPLEIDPNGGSDLYFGDDYVKMYDGSWNTLSQSLTGAATYDYITALSVYNDGTTLYVYAAGYDGTSWKIWKSPSGGGTGSGYVDVTNNLPSNAITDIEISNTDHNTAWVTLGSYDDNRVYQTTDGGLNWTNISDGLPELPAMSIIQNDSNTTEDELYIGMDIGVYVKLGSAPWVLFSDSLPNAVVSDLKFYYGTTSANDTLYGATFARGVWKTEPYQPASYDAAITHITVPNDEYCSIQNITPEVTLANIGTTPLTSADVSYTIDGGTAVTVNWTESGMTQGNSTTVTFPAVQLTYGSHEFIASVTNPNGETDGNTTNDSKTTNYELWNNNLSYTQDFDDFKVAIGYEGEKVDLQECWTNDQSDGGIDWSVNPGSTPSGSTGPSDDHTPGYGNYLFTETSGISGAIIGNLLSPTFDLTNYENSSISFWYHMYGANQGTLKVDVYYNSSWHNDTTVSWNGAGAASGGVSGDQTDNWYQATVNISAADGFSDIQIRLNALTGTDFAGDMSIDDFNITGTPKVAPVTDFVGDPTSLYAGYTVDFTDLSINTPTSWSWNFTGGTPSTSTSQNPTGITYNTSGTYNVSLQATNGIGSNTETKTNYITVLAPEIQFNTATTSTTESTSAGTGCREYTDINLIISVEGKPDVDETVTVSVSSSMANDPADYEITTSMPITCSAGSDANKTVTFRIYDDAAIENAETIDLSMTLGGASCAVLGSQTTHTITINDDDSEPVGSIIVTIWSEDFSSATGWTAATLPGASTNGWLVGNGCPGDVTSGDNCYQVINGGSSCSYAKDLNNIVYAYRTVDATDYTNLTVSFEWKGEGLPAEHDYGQIVYSIDGGSTWTQVPGSVNYSGATLIQNVVDLALPTTLGQGTANPIFLLGWSFQDNNADGAGNKVGATSFAIDNVVVKGTQETFISGTLSLESNEYLGPNSTVYFYDDTNGDLMAKIENTSDHDFGCTTVTIDRSGTAATEMFYEGGTYPDSMIMDKTFLITSETNNTSASYNITFYYSADEIDGWKFATGNIFEDLTLTKTGESISNITPSTQDGNGNTNYLATSVHKETFGSSYYVQGTFSSGFSGFGSGKIEDIPAGKGGPLPVELLSFDGKSVNNQVILNWSTASERNNDYFVIERSKDAQYFEQLSTIKGAGNSAEVINYLYTDFYPFVGINYYRLQQIDYDTETTISKIISVNTANIIKGKNDLFKFYPNPVDNNLFLLNKHQGKITINIYNSVGKLIYSKEINNIDTQAFYELNISHLNSGSYYITVISSVGNYQYKFMKK